MCADDYWNEGSIIRPKRKLTLPPALSLRTTILRTIRGKIPLHARSVPEANQHRLHLMSGPHTLLKQRSAAHVESMLHSWC